MPRAEPELEILETYVGADGRQIRVQATDDDGDAVDLSGYDSASVSAELGSTFKIQAKVATIEGGTDGYVNFTPTAGEIDTAGDYRAQVRVVASSAVDYLQEFILRVKEPIHYTG